MAVGFLGHSSDVLDRIVDSGAKPRSRYNAPQSINSVSRPQGRRWSPTVPPDKNRLRYEKPPLDSPQYWIVTRTETSGSVAVSATYSCSCPDFSREVKATPGYRDDEPDTEGKKYTPRIFPASSYSRYKSTYIRWLKARSILASVQFMGLSMGFQYVYRIPTTNVEKYDREWKTSDAGVKPNTDCKHIIAVRFYRGEDVVQPDDEPDDLRITDLTPLFYEN